MKKLMITVLLLVSNAYADVDTHRQEPITPIVVCGDTDGLAAFEVDKQTITYTTGRGGQAITRTVHQMVLRDEKIIDYFKSEDAIHPSQVNFKGEFIPLGFREDLQIGANNFYSNDYGVTKTVKILPFQNAVILNTYKNGRLLANFRFNDCK